MNPGTLSQADPECRAFGAKRIHIVSRNAFGLECEVSLPSGWLHSPRYGILES